MNRHQITFVLFLMTALLVSSFQIPGPRVLASESIAEPPGDVQALVKVEAAAGLEALVATGVQVQAHFFDESDGREYWPALADPTQQDTLARQGASLHVLDPDSRGATYYLLYAFRPEVFRQARALVTILHESGRQALARATPAQAEQLAHLGIELRCLGQTPLVPRSEQQSPVLLDDFELDPSIAVMVAQVQPSTVRDYTGRLSGEWPAIVGGESYLITTRYTGSGEPIQKATQYVYEHMQTLGLGVNYQGWTSTGYTGRNVVGVITGTTRPDEIVLITAHLDNPGGPGADDNASGSVGVLVAADILSQYEFERTLRFVLFTGEEQGMFGSGAYARRVAGAGENIVAVHNMDMIGYNSDSAPIVDLHARSAIPGSVDIAQTFARVVTAYNLNLRPDILIDYGSGDYSDQASFWGYGYPAILVIEDDDDFTPYYHTPDDRLHTLDMAYFTDNVKASVGTVAHIASPLYGPGVLAGVVSDVDTFTPVADGQVWIDYPPLTFKALTDQDGVYALLVPSGTYTVTASAYGYHPSAVGGVAVASSATTTLDITLTRATSYIVTGTVRDATTGWLLYASINIGSEVYPAMTIWTDPVTGYYSVTLTQDAIYTFDVQDWKGSYRLSNRSVGPLRANSVQNFSLTVDSETCSAPGYRYIGGLIEDFGSGALPAGWTIVDNVGNGQVWRFNNPRNRINNTGGNGLFAIVDSSHYGPSGSQDTELHTPVMDFSAYTSVSMMFKYDFYNRNDEVAEVDVSTDDGRMWTNVWALPGISNRGPQMVKIDLSSIAAGRSKVTVRFHYYNAAYGWYWQVDDVRIGSPTCTVPAGGGLVVGNVYDANTSAPLTGARVTNDSGYAFTTREVLDPAVSDSFYNLFSPSGAHTFTAMRSGGYGTLVTTTNVVQGNAVWQDFYLPAGRLFYAPSSLAVSLTVGMSQVVPFTLTNTGRLPVNWGIAEQPEDVLWLSEAPTSGILTAGEHQVINVTFHASMPPMTMQPGAYYAQLGIVEDTPYILADVPVTMTVIASPSLGHRVYLPLVVK